jgi:hypothetical protein
MRSLRPRRPARASGAGQDPSQRRGRLAHDLTRIERGQAPVALEDPAVDHDGVDVARLRGFTRVPSARNASGSASPVRLQANERAA